MTKRFILKHLAFTGSSSPEARLDFVPGLNIIYGASDTGKTFTSKALKFMLGGSTSLPENEQIERYDAGWLGLTMPDGRDVTLYRATRGGHFRLYDGLVASDDGDFKQLQAGVDITKGESISNFLMAAIGWSGKQIVKNVSAEKDALAVRHVLPYAIVHESEILGEEDPVHHTGQHTEKTLESNVLRFILTGQDDSAAVESVSKKTHQVATRAKLEFVDEMIAQIDQELGTEPPDRGELAEQISNIEATLSGMQEPLRNAQEEIDCLVEHRRFLLNTRDKDAARAAELSITLRRFGLLDQTYTTDLDRLQSLEESGYLLLARADRDCPVCGAAPDVQRHRHAPEEFGLAHRAAAAEARKIALEQRELRKTMASVQAEETGLWSGVSLLNQQIEDVEQQIEAARPSESSMRTDYVKMVGLQSDMENTLDLYQRRDRLVVRRSQIDQTKAPKRKDKLTVGVDGQTAYALGEKIAEVLVAWNFPRGAQAQFDVEAGDVTIAGKARASHGKGVRAVLHAAFNVALLLYCRERKLPHPGFIVLDTPLLTYREPLESKHGELAPDEQALKNSPLAVNFYDYLADLEGDAQAIVLENADPPSEILPRAKVTIFAGKVGEERYGFFPVPSGQRV